MKNLWVIAAVCCLFSLSLFSAQAVGNGNNKYVTKEMKVDDFYRVKINTAFNVVYHHSKDSAGLIRIYGEENILDEVKPVSKDGTLEIKFVNTAKREYGVIILDVYSSDLQEVQSDAGGVFETSGSLSGSELDILLMGNGLVRCNKLDYGIVKARIMTGSGDIFLSGTCREARLSIAGSGEIKGHELKARDVNCNITGNGSIGCWAEENLKAFITGKGDVYYKGKAYCQETWNRVGSCYSSDRLICFFVFTPLKVVILFF